MWLVRIRLRRPLCAAGRCELMYSHVVIIQCIINGLTRNAILIWKQRGENLETLRVCRARITIIKHRIFVSYHLYGRQYSYNRYSVFRAIRTRAIIVRRYYAMTVWKFGVQSGCRTAILDSGFAFVFAASAAADSIFHGTAVESTGIEHCTRCGTAAELRSKGERMGRGVLTRNIYGGGREDRDV